MQGSQADPIAIDDSDSDDGLRPPPPPPRRGPTMARRGRPSALASAPRLTRPFRQADADADGEDGSSFFARLGSQREAARPELEDSDSDSGRDAPSTSKKSKHKDKANSSPVKRGRRRNANSPDEVARAPTPKRRRVIDSELGMESRRDALPSQAGPSRPTTSIFKEDNRPGGWSKPVPLDTQPHKMSPKASRKKLPPLGTWGNPEQLTVVPHVPGSQAQKKANEKADKGKHKGDRHKHKEHKEKENDRPKKDKGKSKQRATTPPPPSSPPGNLFGSQDIFGDNIPPPSTAPQSSQLPTATPFFEPSPDAEDAVPPKRITARKSTGGRAPRQLRVVRPVASPAKNTTAPATPASNTPTPAQPTPARSAPRWASDGSQQETPRRSQPAPAPAPAPEPEPEADVPAEPSPSPEPMDVDFGPSDHLGVDEMDELTSGVESGADATPLPINAVPDVELDDQDHDQDVPSEAARSEAESEDRSEALKVRDDLISPMIAVIEDTESSQGKGKGKAKANGARGQLSIPTSPVKAAPTEPAPEVAPDKEDEPAVQPTATEDPVPADNGPGDLAWDSDDWDALPDSSAPQVPLPDPKPMGPGSIQSEDWDEDAGASEDKPDVPPGEVAEPVEEEEEEEEEEPEPVGGNSMDIDDPDDDDADDEDRGAVVAALEDDEDELPPSNPPVARGNATSSADHVNGNHTPAGMSSSPPPPKKPARKELDGNAVMAQDSSGAPSPASARVATPPVAGSISTSPTPAPTNLLGPAIDDELWQSSSQLPLPEPEGELDWILRGKPIHETPTVSASASAQPVAAPLTAAEIPPPGFQGRARRDPSDETRQFLWKWNAEQSKLTDNPKLHCAIFEAFVSMSTADDQFEEADAPELTVNSSANAAPPFEFFYSNDMFYSKDVPEPELGQGCDCEGPCNPKDERCSCVKRQELYFYQLQLKGFNYTADGKLLDNDCSIWECGPKCGCPPECWNRVIQRGRGANLRLELIKTTNRGWGIRTKVAIAAGTFIGIYAGEVITERESHRRGLIYDQTDRTYLFDLDGYQITTTPTGLSELDPRLAVLTTEAKKRAKALREENFQEEKGANKALKDDKLTDDKRADQALQDDGAEIKKRADEALEDDEDSGYSAYTIDAFHYGFTRFLNHSCDPNVKINQAYVKDFHPERPVLAMFTSRNIRADEELTISYKGPPDFKNYDGGKGEGSAAGTATGTGTGAAPPPRTPKTPKSHGIAAKSTAGHAGRKGIKAPCLCGAAVCNSSMFTWDLEDSPDKRK